MSTDPSGRARPPGIAVTFGAVAAGGDPDLALRRRALYLDRVRDAGGDPRPLDEAASPEARAAALEAMDGLLLTGGADLDPSLYGERPAGSNPPEPGRDALERDAWEAARRRNLPVLGICRGLQAIVVFSGGRLEQHVDGHTGPAYPGPGARHAVRLRTATRLAGLLGGGLTLGLETNSYHHQAARLEMVPAGLRVTATAEAPGGEVVEALEGEDDGRFLAAVQWHPEREDGMAPAAVAPLFEAFVAAARAGRASRLTTLRPLERAEHERGRHEGEPERYQVDRPQRDAEGRQEEADERDDHQDVAGRGAESHG
jgi:putative glutamine amidotransferase